MKISIVFKGGKGSGNWGHSGLKGVHGGSAPQGGSGSSKPVYVEDHEIDFVLDSIDELERTLELNDEYDEDFQVLVMGDTKNQLYKVRTEGWFSDCMESRNMGETCETNIEDNFKKIMERESGWKADISGYMWSFPGAEYGITYIGELVSSDARIKKG